MFSLSLLLKHFIFNLIDWIFICLFYVPLFSSHFLPSPCSHQYKDIYLANLFIFYEYGCHSASLSVCCGFFTSEARKLKTAILDSLESEVVCTLSFTNNEHTWNLEEQVEVIYGCLSSFIWWRRSWPWDGLQQISLSSHWLCMY